MIRRLFTLVAWLALAGLASPCGAQIPDKFTNLKVLPKDISKQDLVSTMRGFAGGLGVRCNYCHAGGTANDLKGMDFASDEKKAKKTARVMMTMVNEINGKLIRKAEIENPAPVRCVTCHHGVTRPETLADILKREFGKGGMDSLKVAYRSLRETHYGDAAYDFKPRTLNEVAEWLSGEKKGDAAIAVMQFNIEQDPSTAYSYNLLGRLQADIGDKDGAIASFKKAIELDPGDKWSAQLLEKLQAGPPRSP
jgi:photosynthetic reaction center cytochrome c subunit/tetratricopeptide repeat protein